MKEASIAFAEWIQENKISYCNAPHPNKEIAGL